MRVCVRARKRLQHVDGEWGPRLIHFQHFFSDSRTSQLGRNEIVKSRLCSETLHRPWAAIGSITDSGKLMRFCGERCEALHKHWVVFNSRCTGNPSFTSANYLCSRALVA